LTSSPYDEVPYQSFPFSQSQPNRLATIGALFGLPNSVSHSFRLLELGCASGGNILPLAAQWPQAEFVGLELSRHQVEGAHEAIKHTGLKNIQVLQKDLLNANEELGRFDFIVAHGVYSWVPERVREKMLAICQDLLTEQGIAYISYNTFPGWHMRGMIRDVMCYRARFFEKPADRLHEARELVNFLASSVNKEGNAYGILLNDELRLLQRKEDYYLLHEFLEEVNEPCYFHEFMERADAHGLQYLGEADFSMMSVGNFPREIMQRLQEISSDVIQMEQYMDFVRNRMFRQTLLCRKEIQLDRSLNPERIFELYVASSSEPETPIADLRSRDRVTFRRPGSTLTTSEPLVKAAMLVLREAWPLAVHFPDLLSRARAKLHPDPIVIEADRDRRDARVLAEPLLRCFATTHVELSVSPSAPQLEVTEHPRATRLARYQAEQGEFVTNLWHEAVRLSDVERHLLRHLDGERDRASLAELLLATVREGKLIVRDKGEPIKDEVRVREIVEGILDQNLCELARKGFFLR
jgi:Predicted regulatory domain of a methyltransferase